MQRLSIMERAGQIAENRRAGQPDEIGVPDDEQQLTDFTAQLEQEFRDAIRDDASLVFEDVTRTGKTIVISAHAGQNPNLVVAVRVEIPAVITSTVIAAHPGREEAQQIVSGLYLNRESALALTHDVIAAISRAVATIAPAG